MTIKQYVNLPTDYDKNHGNRVKIEVNASQLTEKDIQRAEWWIEPDANNQDEKYLSRFQRARMRWENTRNHGDKFHNFFLLPHVGGDKYVVKCSKRGDRSSPKDSEEIETWRKLFYTVHYMNAQCQQFATSLQPDFEAAFEEAFVEIEHVKSIKTLVDEPHTESSLALTHLYKTRPRLADRPHHIRLVLINNLYEPEDKRYRLRTTDKVKVVNIRDFLVPKRSIKSVKARPVNQKRWYTLTRHTTKTGDKQVTIRLEDYSTIKKALADGTEIELVIKLRVRGEYCGHSIGNFCCVRIKEPGTAAERKAMVLQTITHEIGHGCQQVVRFEKQYDGDGNATGLGWRNPKWHTNDEGGQGPHCTTGAKLIPNVNAAGDVLEDTTSGNHWAYDAGVLCTMYYRGESHVDVDGKFCDNCIERFIRTDLGTRQMRKQGWTRY